jgi:uncharacterized protein (DUF1330 family)
MPAYMIVRAEITDEERYGLYRRAVLPLIETFGGKHIRTGSVELLEGEQKGRGIALFEFATMDAIRAFWNSPEYFEVKALRLDAALLEIWAVPASGPASYFLEQKTP